MVNAMIMLISLVSALSPLFVSIEPGPIPVDGIIVESWAESPLLVDPVAFCIDMRGRVYVAETARQELGVEDSRAQSYWNLDDISLQSNADRLAMYEKWAHKFEGGMEHFTRHEDRIRLVVDSDRDGRADTSSIFSSGYNDALDGTGSGLLVHGNDVYYTNIPHLWRLQDTDADGVADVQESMFDGFGVRIALRGHDMHGLTWGPDGRLYWSIGDRGYNVMTREGQHLFDPTSGAVFRCDPDGSNLEVFHTGLRNPQELAFDDYGTLFTGDNNSDGGDRARLVHVAEGGQTGWRMEYQSLGAPKLRGPWNQEGIWHERHAHQPAWIIPPVTNIASGPAGFVHYPGLGLDERYADHFFLCDFTGSPQHSRVLSFAVEPVGAGYTITDVHPFVSGVLCTDVDFGWDGKMYISDWVEGWVNNDNGRILTAHDPDHIRDPRIQTAQRAAAKGFSSLPMSELSVLLTHADQRVRLQAQFALAGHGDEAIASLATAAKSGSQRTRLHAIWGLGMVARATVLPQVDPNHPMALVLELLEDSDREVRGQAAKVLGEAGYQPAAERITEHIFDEEPRVVYHATMAAGRMQHQDAMDAVIEMLITNNNEDALLRHAGVMALTWMDDRSLLLEYSRDEFPSVRLAVLLALRRMKDPAVELFLHDPDPLIAAEAARAINDEPIEVAMPALADRIEEFRSGDAVTEETPSRSAILRRAINAAMRSGRPEDAAALADVALHEGHSASIRLEGLGALGDWMSPSVRDRVNGAYRPVELNDRNRKAWRAVLARTLPRLAGTQDASVATAARELAVEASIPLDDQMVQKTLRDWNAPSRDRIASLHQLARDDGQRAESILIAVDEEDDGLHIAALRLLAEDDPGAAFDWVQRDLNIGSVPRKQGAVEVLGLLDVPAAARVIADLYSQVISGEQPPELHLEIRESLSGRKEETIRFLDVMVSDRERDPTVKYANARAGGDMERGRKLVRYHAAAACLRCHAIDGHGGVAGPDLSDVGNRLDRSALLESIIDPGAVLAEGYGEVTAMPPMTDHLSPREVRDIVEYLSTARHGTSQ
jgi:quinoprotein glucose dehydrogenase